jgi:hypothetical protein
MPIAIESEIRSRVEAFAEELIALLRESAMDVVKDALGETAASRRGGRGRASAPRASMRPKGAKRDPNVLEALTEKLGAFIKKNPGQRIEQIGKALGTPTKELALPVKKLVAAKKISTTGQKRSTKYFAASGRGSSPVRGTKRRANAGAGKVRGRKAARRAPSKTTRRKPAARQKPAAGATGPSAASAPAAE